MGETTPRMRTHGIKRGSPNLFVEDDTGLEQKVLSLQFSIRW